MVVRRAQSASASYLKQFRKQELGARIDELREALGQSEESFVKEAGLSVAAYKQIKSGRHSPSPWTIKRIINDCLPHHKDEITQLYFAATGKDAMPPGSEVGKLLRKVREHAGHTQVQLAGWSQVTEVTIQNIEIGYHAPQPKKFENVASVYPGYYDQLMRACRKTWEQRKESRRALRTNIA